MKKSGASNSYHLVLSLPIFIAFCYSLTATLSICMENTAAHSTMINYKTDGHLLKSVLICDLKPDMKAITRIWLGPELKGHIQLQCNL